MPLDLDAIQARFDAWADPPVDPGDLDDTEIDALWKSANDVPRLLAKVERQDAELRLAREEFRRLQEALEVAPPNGCSGELWDGWWQRYLWPALAAYDAAKETSHGG